MNEKGRIDMKENDELTNLEDEWKSRFDRFTAPEPTREQSISLIEKIKAVETEKPVDLRVELEQMQESQSFLAQVSNLFQSQLNFHGMRSWLLTAIMMLLVTITISNNWGGRAEGFTVWIKWTSLIMIAIMGYAFRAKNEGNDILEKLSYTPLIQQMFTRFIIVLVLQLAISLPLSYMVLGGMNSILYIISAFMPLLFFGVVGFVGIIWFGQKLGATLALVMWFGQVLLEDRVKNLSLFQVPENDYFLLVNFFVFGISCLLLSSLILKKRQLRYVG